MKKTSLLLAGTSFFSLIGVTACGGGGTPTPTSQGSTFSSLTLLGSNVNHATADDIGPEISSNG